VPVLGYVSVASAAVGHFAGHYWHGCGCLDVVGPFAGGCGCLDVVGPCAGEWRHGCGCLDVEG